MNTLPRTARETYRLQGAGIGAGALAFEWLRGVRYYPANYILEVGCGNCAFVQKALEVTNVRLIFAVDLAPAAIHAAYALDSGYVAPLLLDVSHEALPIPDDQIDLAVCTETLEHLANPYHAVAEIKRVLAPDGIFVVSFPQPDRCLGYGAWKHSMLYPGFLRGDSFALFMRQMYFAVLLSGMANEYMDWHVYANYKGPGMQDIFQVMASDVDEEATYGMLAAYTERQIKERLGHE
jgi:SAM-dependent methyltransferase